MSKTLWPAPVQRIVLRCKIPHDLDVLKWKVKKKRKILELSITPCASNQSVSKTGSISVRLQDKIRNYTLMGPW
jgi:hypothetical protein